MALHPAEELKFYKYNDDVFSKTGFSRDMHFTLAGWMDGFPPQSNEYIPAPPPLVKAKAMYIRGQGRDNAESDTWRGLITMDATEANNA